MSDSLRSDLVQDAKLIVVKVGTRVLTHANAQLNHQRIAELANELSQLFAQGRRAVLVSSGAVAAGMSQMNLAARPSDISHLQAVASIGQTKLIEAYDRTLRQNERHAAQVLLTADDLNDRARYLNVRNTLLTLLEFGAVPIVNENDTVAVDELMTTFGDNDRLAAMVTSLIGASLHIILSDVEGLYDGDPSDANSKLISCVPAIDDNVQALVRDKKTGLSKGGMASKLAAARLATSAGASVIIASGRSPNVLAKIMAGEQVGTLFLPLHKSVSPLKRWIGYSAQPRGKIRVDDGAQKAILEKGKSLLAVGVVAVEGDFRKGDVVSLCRADGAEIARGLTNYGAADVTLIKGLKSNQIAVTLSHAPYAEVVHCDNMALVELKPT